MGRTVIVASGRIKDLYRFRTVMRNAVRLVEEQLPGTETYEFYVDEQSGRYTSHEAFANDEAILDHLEAFMRSGLVEQLPDLVDFDFNVSLGGPEDPRAREAMEQMGFRVHELEGRAEH